MGDFKDKGIDETVARLKEKVAQEVEQHASEDVDLEDLEDASGGWFITYVTDSSPSTEEGAGSE